MNALWKRSWMWPAIGQMKTLNPICQFRVLISKNECFLPWMFLVWWKWSLPYQVSPVPQTAAPCIITQPALSQWATTRQALDGSRSCPAENSTGRAGKPLSPPSLLLPLAPSDGECISGMCVTNSSAPLQLASSVTPWDILLSLIAAATHDLDHPGVNQPFLIKTNHYLATLYKVSPVSLGINLVCFCCCCLLFLVCA